MMRNSSPVRMALILIGLLIFMSWVIPWHAHPYRSFFNDLLAICAVFAGLFCLTVLRPAPILSIPHSILLPFGMVLVICVQTAKGMVLFPADSIFPVLYLICVAIAMTVGATVASSELGAQQLAVALAVAFLAAGLASVLFELIQIFDLGMGDFVVPIGHVNAIRPYANIRQSNMLALLLCFSLASGWYLFVVRRLRPIILIVFVFVLLTGLALAQSRMAWLVTLLFFCIIWQKNTEMRNVSRFMLALFALFFVLLTVCLPEFMAYCSIPFETLAGRTGQTAVRVTLWKQAWLMSTLHPWFGAGWFQFGAQQMLVANRFEPTEGADYAHNIVLNFAAEIGWPCTLLLLVVVGVWFYRCCICKWKDAQVRYFSLTLLATMIHSMLEFPLWFAYVLMPVGIIVGALHASTLKLEAANLPRSAATLALTAMVALTGFISWDYMRIVTGFVSLKTPHDWIHTRVASIQKPSFTFYSQYFDYLHVVEIGLHPGMLDQDMRFLERVAARYPFPPIMNKLAIAYAYQHQYDDAIFVLNVLNHLYLPSSDETYKQWANLARHDPNTFGPVFVHFLQPVSVNSSKPIGPKDDSAHGK